MADKAVYKCDKIQSNAALVCSWFKSSRRLKAYDINMFIYILISNCLIITVFLLLFIKLSIYGFVYLVYVSAGGGTILGWNLVCVTMEHVSSVFTTGQLSTQKPLTPHIEASNMAYIFYVSCMLFKPAIIAGGYNGVERADFQLPGTAVQIVFVSFIARRGNTGHSRIFSDKFNSSFFF